MKTSNLPSLRVDPELRAAAESVLVEGESLSAFMEVAIREGVERRRMRQEFLQRGLLGAERARQTGEYYSSEQVLDELRAAVEARRRELKLA